MAERRCDLGIQRPLVSNDVNRPIGEGPLVIKRRSEHPTEAQKWHRRNVRPIAFFLDMRAVPRGFSQIYHETPPARGADNVAFSMLAGAWSSTGGTARGVAVL